MSDSMIDSLLGETRFAELRRRLAANQTSAPPHGLISITLDLGEGDAHWLPAPLDRSGTFWWAQPETGDFRLAQGQALLITTDGPTRFSALQAAFAGLAATWRHDDAGTGILPAAHLGFAFDAHAGEIDDDAYGSSHVNTRLDGLPNSRLLVPAVLLQTRNGRCSASFSCIARDSQYALDYWRNTLLAARDATLLPHSRQGVIHLQREDERLSERAFLARAQAALNAITCGSFEKLVLSRRARLRADAPFDLNRLAAALMQRQPNCTIYGVGKSGGCFIGATPERLVTLRGGEVQADALAGTAWLGKARAEQAGSLQLHDEKNSREQQIVVNAVIAALAPLCRTLDTPAAQVMQIRELQHLRSRIVGQIKPEVGLFDLLARLHPTPAVGGTPTLAASDWLRAHGDERAAWYTGGIGWIDCQGDGEVAVALRCARIRGAQAELLAGAGIVAGSDPAQELAETEAKLGTILGALEALSRPMRDNSQPPSSHTGTHP